MNKKLPVEQLAPIKIDEEHMQQVIRLGQKKLLQRQGRRYSLKHLFVVTLRFVPPYIWGLQLVLIGLTLPSRYFLWGPEVRSMLLYLTGLIFLSVLFFFHETFKSFTSGTWELEQTFKYDLRQLTMMKLLIFGVSDAALIVLCAVLCYSTMSLPLGHALLFLFVPYNVLCSMLLFALISWRDRLSNMLLVVIVATLGMLLFWVVVKVELYQLQMIYWLVAYVISGFILLGITLATLQKIGSIGRVCKWNWN